MRKLILMMLFTIIVIGTASAQKTIYYVSDYTLDFISKEQLDGKAVFSFTTSTISLQWVGKKLDFKIITSKNIKEENVIVHWVTHTGKDGKQIPGIVEVIASKSENEYPMITYKSGESIYYAFHTIDSYANY